MDSTRVEATDFPDFGPARRDAKVGKNPSDKELAGPPSHDPPFEPHEDRDARWIWAFWADVPHPSHADEVALRYVQIVLGVRTGTNELFSTRQLPAKRFDAAEAKEEKLDESSGDAQRLQAELRNAIAESREQANGEDAVFNLLERICNSHYRARANLAAWERHYAKDILRAASKQRGSDAANIDDALAGLSRVMLLAGQFRDLLGIFKPSGRDAEKVWLWPVSHRGEERSIALVKKVHGIRKDLNKLEQQLRDSAQMAVAVQARNVVRTAHAAKQAGVVAGALTLVLASVGLFGTLAAIPGESLLVPSASATGLSVIFAAAVGWIVWRTRASNSAADEKPALTAQLGHGLLGLIALAAFVSGLTCPSTTWAWISVGIGTFLLVVAGVWVASKT